MSKKKTRERRVGHPLLCAVAAMALPCSALPQPGLISAEGVREETVYALGAEPVTLLLSKSKYPAEDLHLDAIVWLQAPDTEARAGELRLSLHDGAGRPLVRDTITPIPGGTVFFSFAFPPALAGSNGVLRVAWFADGKTLGEAASIFTVLPPANPPLHGRVRLQLPNPNGAVMRGLPVTVGVPFPRGALHDADAVRLVDEQNREVPLQVLVTSRWSRFGSIRWIQCDFSADLSGNARDFFLEYGPGTARRAGPDMTVRSRQDAPPSVDAGTLRFGDGVEADLGAGYRSVMPAEALHGAFVEHENGKRFQMPAETAWEVEEQGSEKVVLRRRGWYTETATGDRFCRFDTRFCIYRNSPLLRIFHTWIFTGYPYEKRYRWVNSGEIEHLDGTVAPDRIRNMGWRFALGEDMKGDGFLAAGEHGAPWLRGDWLLQFDHDKRELAANGEITTDSGRAAGVAAATGNAARLLLGVKDFWQNFPNELEFADSALYFHQWPRHGKPRTHPVRIEDALRLWFAHEGECLDFALPEEWLTDDAFFEAAPNPDTRKHIYSQRGRRETVNAQGIAKTAEIWLLLTAPDTALDTAARVLGGLNDGTLRAVVDPQWLAGTGALYEMHPYDPETYPREEYVYDLHCRAPGIWMERMDFYGKWIWADMTWEPDPEGRGFGLYRGFRKAHQGWPYSWIPFARSGNPEFLRVADAATRHLTDVAFCHYSDERVPGRLMDKHQPRPRGFYIRFRIPWACHTANPSSRGYIDKCNYLWHSYYLTGYPRARDVALDWAQLTKTQGANNWGAPHDDRLQFQAPLQGDARRGSTTLLQSYTEMYQATFDPWFLAASYQIARAHTESWREHGWEGHFWNSGPREFQRFTGSDDYAEFYLAYARSHCFTHRETATSNWAWYCGMLEPSTYAYLLTGDRAFLGTAAFWLDYADIATYDGKVEALRGWLNGPMFTGYFLQYFPYALEALKRAGVRSAREEAEGSFFQLCPAGENAPEGTDFRYCIALRKDALEPMPLRLKIQVWKKPPKQEVQFRCRVTAPDGETIVADSWDINKREIGRPTIPAAAPQGIYRVWVEGPRNAGGSGRFNDPALSLPISPFGVPETLEIEPGTDLGRAVPASQYWFQVPKNVTEFWIELFWYPMSPTSPRDFFRRFSIWNPAGERVWDRHFTRSDQPETSSVRALVKVPPEQAGKLWRLGCAGVTQRIVLDPAIPRIFATSRARWFPSRD